MKKLFRVQWKINIRNWEKKPVSKIKKIILKVKSMTLKVTLALEIYFFYLYYWLQWQSEIFLSRNRLLKLSLGLSIFLLFFGWGFYLKSRILSLNGHLIFLFNICLRKKPWHSVGMYLVCITFDSKHKYIALTPCSWPIDLRACKLN